MITWALDNQHMLVSITSPLKAQKSRNKKKLFGLKEQINIIAKAYIQLPRNERRWISDKCDFNRTFLEHKRHWNQRNWRGKLKNRARSRSKQTNIHPTAWAEAVVKELGVQPHPQKFLFVENSGTDVSTPMFPMQVINESDWIKKFNPTFFPKKIFLTSKKGLHVF